MLPKMCPIQPTHKLGSESLAAKNFVAVSPT
jgi:hypothetical protein